MPALPTLGKVFDLGVSDGLPCHIRRYIRTPTAKRHDVINDVAGARGDVLAGGRAGEQLREVCFRRSVTHDICVSECRQAQSEDEQGFHLAAVSESNSRSQAAPAVPRSSAIRAMTLATSSARRCRSASTLAASLAGALGWIAWGLPAL